MPCGMIRRHMPFYRYASKERVPVLTGERMFVMMNSETRA